jgi:hypothetical protein
VVLKLKKKNKYIGIDNEFDDYQLDGQENDGLLELASMLAHLVKEDNETIYHFEGKNSYLDLYENWIQLYGCRQDKNGEEVGKFTIHMPEKIIRFEVVENMFLIYLKNEIYYVLGLKNIVDVEITFSQYLSKFRKGD